VIPVPFAAQPGDRLTVTQNHPCGTDLKAGDIVTVLDTGVHVENGLPVPVVQVSTSYGPQVLTLDTVVKAGDLPAVQAAEPDEVVDAFFWRILGNDDELRDWAVKAREELAANDPQDEPSGGGTSTMERVRRTLVGEPLVYEDRDGDELEVAYFEEECKDHGRHGGFMLSVNDEEAVIIPAEQVDGLIRYLFSRRNHSRRPPEMP
jgi:hypothetical protein